jgi:hypothetical protein
MYFLFAFRTSGWDEEGKGERRRKSDRIQIPNPILALLEGWELELDWNWIIR